MFVPLVEVSRKLISKELNKGQIFDIYKVGVSLEDDLRKCCFPGAGWISGQYILVANASRRFAYESQDTTTLFRSSQAIA